MLFNSFEFAVFFPVVLLLYFALPYRYRWMLLLGASYYFYMCWKVEYAALIIVSTLVDYVAAARIAAARQPSRRKAYLACSIAANLGILFAFKYFNFVNDSLRALFNEFNIFYEVPAFELLLPVGISFYTFQSLSYTIDVYRGRQQPERHLGIFALYVSFFPQLVAGPIERSTHLLPQFRRRFDFDYRRVTDGLKLMAWGFFKKLVIADRVAVIVDIIYANPSDYTGLALIAATVFFAFQIYCDFSGYSDIAIGAAQIMGYDLMDNFNRPYHARSIGDFWRRWHISLSTWFRDYVYIPLGGSRVPVSRMQLNLLLTFVISGLWHGANWTFVVWGALHAVYMIIGRAGAPLRQALARRLGLDRLPTLYKAMQILTTFALVCYAWIFFRAASLADAWYISTHLFSDLGLLFDPAGLRALIANTGLSFNRLAVAVAAIVFMEIVHLMQRHSGIRHMLSGKPAWLRWPIYYAVLMAILLLGVFEENQFIYFQF